MADGGIAGIRIRQSVPTPEPRASIDTNAQSRVQQAANYSAGGSLAGTGDYTDLPQTVQTLYAFAEADGDISHMLDEAVVNKLGIDAVRQWEIDAGSRQAWKNLAERSLNMAAQEDSDDDDEQAGDGLWDNSADIRYPILTTASQQFAARAGPELIKGDSVVGVKSIILPQKKPTPGQVVQEAPKPQTPQAGQAAAQGLQQAKQQDNDEDLAAQAREARAARVKAYLNWLIFYKMDDWEGETDLLLHQIPITGSAFKKIYMGTSGLCSSYVSALRLTVHNDTKSIYRCPRITEDFEVYPYEVDQRQRAGIYRDVELPKIGEDPEQPRQFIEQHRMDDLDGDGLAEPYVVTVDVETKTTMRVEPAYTRDDIYLSQREDPDTGEIERRVSRIDRWNAYASYLFLPDPRGKFYGIGFGRLLESITDSVDTSINQLLDAGTAEIAGGGFIASGVRLQGSGQGGALYFRPGEYSTVGFAGQSLREAIWERTVPHPSDVTFKLLELLLAAAKDVASIKDVNTGESPTTAPVGTTLAVQNQALQVYSAIWKRIFRGFRDEFRMMYRALQRWATDREIREYAEVTGGDLREDFTGDGTDIQPVADPAVVTNMQRTARVQAMLQLSDSPTGQAAGMQMPGPAQKLAKMAMDTFNIESPEDYVADVPPNPLMQAKAEDLAATAKLKGADAQVREATVHKLGAETHAKVADATHTQAKTVRELGLAAGQTAELHAEADRINRSGTIAKPEALIDPVAEAEKDRESAEKPKGPETNGKYGT